MINVPIDKIVPLTTARDTLSKIVAEVESNTPMYVLTKGGKPSVAVVNIDYLEKALDGRLIAADASTDTSTNTNQDTATDQTTSESTAVNENQTQPETTSPPPGPPPVEEPVQLSAEAAASPTETTSWPTSVRDTDQSQQHDEFWKTPPALASQPPVPPFEPSTSSQSSTSPPPQNIALGSMDGIQSKDGIQSEPFIEPKEEQKPVDPDMAPPPGQYAGSTDSQTGTGSTGTGNEPADMVID